MHQLEHVRRRARGSAPVVGDRAVREVRVDLARMHRTALAHELEDRPGALVGGGRRHRRARMHQRLHRPCHEAVVDEEVLFDRQRLIPRLEVAGAVALDARPQRQVLGAGRGADGIGLHEAEPIERVFERGRRKQAAADGKAPQILQCAHQAKTLLSCHEGDRASPSVPLSHSRGLEASSRSTRLSGNTSRRLTRCSRDGTRAMRRRFAFSGIGIPSSSTTRFRGSSATSPTRKSGRRRSIATTLASRWRAGMSSRIGSGSRTTWRRCSSLVRSRDSSAPLKP